MLLTPAFFQLASYQKQFAQISILLLVVLQTACSSSGKQWNPDDYTVKSGDTVFSIAWRYELDPEEFAAWNKLGDSYVIRPGQRLHTRKPAGFETSLYHSQSEPRGTVTDSSVAYAPTLSGETISPGSPWVKVSKGDSLYLISQRSGVSVEELAKLNQLKKPYVIQPGQTIFLKPLRSSLARNESKAAKPAKSVSSDTAVSKQTAATGNYKWPRSIRWQRPASGKVVKRFNRRKNDAKGIDITGKKGQAIKASAAGKVVYSGNGLISYGNLIIIKHNKTFLSAYAYNRKLLVKEGDIVKAGQKIAEMGSKDRQSPRLHFEIRKNGKPVDPLKYIPWS